VLAAAANAAVRIGFFDLEALVLGKKRIAGVLGYKSFR
jgi:hypothetical protein